MRRALLLSLAVLAGGCLTRVPPQKATVATPIAIGWGLDSEREGTALPAPERLQRRVAATLGDRNLQAKDLGAVGGARLSSRRLEALRQGAGEGWVLLIEARPAFFSQLNGRYRWSVAVKLTASSKSGEVVDDAFTAPALLQYEHEREAEALAAVADDVAQRVGTLIDALLLAGPPQTKRGGGLVYFVMIDRFFNGESANDGAIDLKDPAAFHGGDLAGVLARLDWLEALGVGTVWLSPPFLTRTAKVGPRGAFHGYWTWDLNRLEPRFGDEAALKRLADALHQRGMRLMLDLVLNHVGPDAPLLKQQPAWFHRQGDVRDWNDPAQLVDGDVHGLPDFATERDDVYAHLLAASRKWVRAVRPDGFRLDAVKHVPLGFWARFNDDLRREAGPDFELLGELLEGDPAVVARAWREGHFSSMFDFPLHFALTDVFCRGESPARLGAVLTSDRLYPDPAGLTTLADNHDLPRLLTACGGDEAKAAEALAFLLTARGTPSIIWGTEVGLTGEKDPANRASMIFRASPLKDEISRWARARAEHPALSSGATRIVAATHEVFAYQRLVDDQAALIVVNRGAVPWKLPPVHPESSRGASVWRSLDDQAATGAPPNALSIFLTPRAKGAFAALAAAARAPAPVREVRFLARGVPDSSEVRLVGSGPELGGWKPERGLALTAGQGAAGLPLGGVFEFKLAVKSSAGAWRWQGGANQLLWVDEHTLQVEVSWRDG